MVWGYSKIAGTHIENLSKSRGSGTLYKGGSFIKEGLFQEGGGQKSFPTMFIIKNTEDLILDFRKQPAYPLIFIRVLI